MFEDYEPTESLLDGDFSCETTEEDYEKYEGYTSVLDTIVEVDGVEYIFGKLLYNEN